MNTDIQEINNLVQKKSATIGNLFSEIGRVIVGQDDLIRRLIIGLLADGHVLIEGVPGLAKTLAVKTLAECISASFQRIQFTPDLLPADLIGTQIYNATTHKFTPRKGPIFANLILADEINRAPPKVQSALLESMQEHQVTIGDLTHPLEAPFLVLATQNPIEHEGTYPLPEAQVDRFMLKVVITYPSREEERLIIERTTTGDFPQTKPIITPSQILELRHLVQNIYVDSNIQDYVLDLIFATREPQKYNLKHLSSLISYGISPRGTTYLISAAKAQAFLEGRGFVTPEDIKEIALDVLRHRLILSYEAEAEEISSDEIILQILDSIEIP
jgi:MoxR-like ATPase